MYLPPFPKRREIETKKNKSCPKERNLIYKIKPLDANTVCEIKISKKIKEIDDYFVFFDPIVEWKKMTTSEWILLTYTDTSDYQTLDCFFSRNWREKETIKKMMETFETLDTALQKLNEKEIACSYLAPMMNTQGQVILTDFSRSFFWKEEKDNSFKGMPLELFVLNWMKQRGIISLSKANAEEIVNQFLSMERNVIEAEIIPWVLSLVNQPNLDLLQYAKTWNHFTLCQFYLCLFEKAREKIPLLEEWKKGLQQGCHRNPIKRTRFYFL